ncbi:MAG: nuclear transport factor 2 family protein [Bacteroidota bacterium]|nr:nuclear transport factor 2 family protein [Bacteroidota bacterium]
MKTIEDFFTTYKEAVWRKDADALLALYDTDVIQFDMWDRGFYPNLTEWKPGIEDWLGSLGNEKVKVDFEMIKIHLAENIGFASGLIKFEAISEQGDVLRSMKNRITVGFYKGPEHWVVVHQHISAPISSENLNVIFNI